MSRAFLKEDDGQWLHDISPTMQALVRYLTIENNGIGVYEKSNFVDKQTGKEVHVMSNGFSYSVGEDGKWFALD